MVVYVSLNRMILKHCFFYSFHSFHFQDVAQGSGSVNSVWYHVCCIIPPIWDDSMGQFVERVRWRSMGMVFLNFCNPEALIGSLFCQCQSFSFFQPKLNWRGISKFSWKSPFNPNNTGGKNKSVFPERNLSLCKNNLQFCDLHRCTVWCEMDFYQKCLGILPCFMHMYS